MLTKEQIKMLEEMAKNSPELYSEMLDDISNNAIEQIISDNQYLN